MTEMKTYKCDRCYRIFQKPIDETPSTVTRNDNDFIPDEHPTVFQLCGDCMTRFWDWEIHDEDFDKFAKSMAKQWQKESEEK